MVAVGMLENSGDPLLCIGDETASSCSSDAVSGVSFVAVTADVESGSGKPPPPSVLSSELFIVLLVCPSFSYSVSVLGIRDSVFKSRR
jgi:hypothetical protein